ncbi:MAG: response regulator transcription factor [Clostridia bacterium]|nr:response regulator transcription factor [Clostridia bacterium]
MLRLILCDDNPRHNQIMTHHLQEILPRLPMPAEIALATTDPREVLAYAEQNDGDAVYLLDLELDHELSGLDVCRNLHRLRPTADVIYVSAYAEYAMECFQSHAFDFILKPYTPQRLENALRDAILHIQRSRIVYPLHVTAGSVTRVLNQKEILWLKMDREYVTAIMTSGEFTWRESLTRLMPRLNPDWFIRIHKSCAINRLYIQHLDTKSRELTMKDGSVLTVSRRLIHEVTGVMEPPAAPQA